MPARSLFRSRAWKISVPLVLTAAASVIALRLGSVVAAEVPFFAAVLGSLWLAGPLAGLLAILASGASILYFFLPPAFAFRSEGFHVALELAGFLTISGFLVWYVRSLSEARDLLAATFRSLEEGVIIADRRGLVQMMNPTAQRLTGWTERNARGQPLNAMLVLRDRKTREQVESAATVLLRGAVPDESWRPRLLVGHSGGEALVEEAAALIGGREPTGGAVLVLRDITEREALNARMQHAERLQSVGRLAAGIAHQFNNLLLQVTGFTDLAVASLPEGHKARPLLQMAIDASDRAAKLVRQMLGLAGKGKFVTEQINLTDLAADTAELIEGSIPANVAVVIDAPADAPAITADRSQIQQILTNLLENAFEAIGGEPGEVRIRTAVEFVDSTSPNGWYTPTGVPPGTYGCVEIRDTGRGMDEATISRIFEPFFTTKALGRGLGLAAVHGIVRSYGGAVYVQSRPGGGAAFKVLLPLAAAQNMDRVRSK